MGYRLLNDVLNDKIKNILQLRKHDGNDIEY